MKLKPIETAPKDGTAILLYMEGGFIEGYYCVETASYMPQEPWITHTLSSHGCGCCARADKYPTHWCELPKLESDNG